MSWQIYLTISMALYSVTVLLQRAFLKDENSEPVAYAVVTQLTVALISLILAIRSGLVLPQPENRILFSLLIMVIAYAISSILTFKTVKIIEASEYTILIFTRAFWSVTLSIILLNEQFTASKIIGTALIFLSVVLVSWKGKKIKFGKGEFLGLLAAALLGAAFINDAILLANIDFWMFMTMAFGLPPIATLLFFPKSLTSAYKLIISKHTWKPILVGLLFFGSGSTTYLALDKGKNPGQIAAISPVAVILIVILSAIFLKERGNLFKKFLAALICFVGVALVST